jgi:predicted nuclease of restriction endonuclease-like RecB superfamily
MMNLLMRFLTKTPANVGKRGSSLPYSTKKHGKRIPSKVGHRSDIPEVLEFQSVMEANVFRFYKSKRGLTVEYEAEYFRFPKGASTLGVYGYVPDFKISDGKRTWYIEVKGWMDKNAREKDRLMRTYYPKVKLYYITPVEYKKISDAYRHKIRDWE